MLDLSILHISNGYWRRCKKLSSYKNGSYILKEKAGNSHKHITRLGGVDRSEILYIGKSTKLPKRIRSLQQSISFIIYDSQDQWYEKGHKSLS